uniref:PDZ domain-containing protein n=1 Tax=Eptatretus burgeri TaxID=7764 RepID=A0A8C4R7J6_EPTBU
MNKKARARARAPQVSPRVPGAARVSSSSAGDVEPGSPAALAGLRAGDRLVAVNGDDVEGGPHREVVRKIGERPHEVYLLVVDSETDDLLKRRQLKCTEAMAVDGLPDLEPPTLSSKENRGEVLEDDHEDDRGREFHRETSIDIHREDDGRLEFNGPTNSDICGEDDHEGQRKDSSEGGATFNGDRPDVEVVRGEPVVHDQEGMVRNFSRGRRDSDAEDQECGEDHADQDDETSRLRPRLCHITKGDSGFGFNLHTEKGKPGQYIRAIDPGLPAERAGLRLEDRLLTVNGTNVLGKKHGEVVALIRDAGDRVEFLVVGTEGAAFFESCRVSPGLEHLSGPLPERVVNGRPKSKVNEDALQTELLPTHSSGKPMLEELEFQACPGPMPVSPGAESSLSETKSPSPTFCTKDFEEVGVVFDLSAAAAKEMIQAKRNNKRAPQMDWGMKNQLFGNF